MPEYWFDTELDDDGDVMLTIPRDISVEAARHAARNADDAKVIRMLRDYADDIESEGRRGHSPQWMREAADRLARRQDAM